MAWVSNYIDVLVNAINVDVEPSAHLLRIAHVGCQAGRSDQLARASVSPLNGNWCLGGARSHEPAPDQVIDVELNPAFEARALEGARHGRCQVRSTISADGLERRSASTWALSRSVIRSFGLAFSAAS
jgi:hypothetical protein